MHGELFKTQCLEKVRGDTVLRKGRIRSQILILETYDTYSISHAPCMQGTDVKALSVQTRDIGERSWSVLDTEAVTGLKAELKAAASQIENEQ